MIGVASQTNFLYNQYKKRYIKIFWITFDITKVVMHNSYYGYVQVQYFFLVVLSILY